MALISFENLGLYHQKLKDWIAKLKINASNIIQDDNNKLVTKAQVESWENKLDSKANALSASKLFKPVRINGVLFDGTKDIEITPLNYNLDKEIKHYIKLESNKTTIEIPDNIALANGIFNLYVDGLRMIEEITYSVDMNKKIITLLHSYEKPVDVELSLLKTLPQTSQFAMGVENGNLTIYVPDGSKPPKLTLENGHLFLHVDDNEIVPTYTIEDNGHLYVDIK